MNTAYSGTPLARKLGLKDGHRVLFQDMPESVRAEIDAYGVVLQPVTTAPFDVIHVFDNNRTRLADRLAAARDRITENGMIWVSWPKKASRVPSDITEDSIRELAFPLGLVDVKVCAVDAIWSGLKLVIRKELRA